MADQQAITELASELKDLLNGDSADDMAETIWAIIQQATKEHDTETFAECLDQLRDLMGFMLHSL